MSAEAEMQYLGTDRGFKVYWADERFEKPGLYIWDEEFKKNVPLILHYKELKHDQERMFEAYKKGTEDNLYIFDAEFWHKKMPRTAKDWVNQQFPLEHYSEKIIDSKDCPDVQTNAQLMKVVYEAWDLRSLLEMAYAAGLKMGAANKREGIKTE